MAVSERIIEPWEGPGWPVELFDDAQTLKDRRLYFCTRNECGKKYNRILRDPYQLNCGHRVCKKCLDCIREIPENQRYCDACREEQYDETHSRDRLELMDTTPPTSSLMETDAQVVIESTPGHSKIDPNKTISDRAASREINKLEVQCPYKCGTEEYDEKRLVIRNLERHMHECEFRSIPCSRCTDTVVFKDLKAHLRDECPFREVDCPNGCGKKGLKGKDLAQHQAECEKKPPICRLCMNEFKGSHHVHLMTDCKASCPFGCKDVQQGALIVDHLNDPSKQEQHVRALLTMAADVKEAQANLQGGAMGVGMPQQQRTAILDRLLQLECRSERTQRQLTDKVEKLTDETAAALLENAGKAESNRKELDDLDALFKVLAGDVHMLTSYDATFRSLTEKVNKQETETAERLNKLEGLSNIRLAEIEDQKTALNHYQMTSFNGKLIWRIDRVAAKRSESHIRHSIFSHPFYTEVYGYKMCARLYFNGDGNGKNSHISLFFVIMRGDFDALLPWPFQQKVTMKLKNQAKKRQDIVEKFRPEPSSSSFAKPKNEMNIASGCPQFATQEMVFEPQNGFVVDDTMFIEIVVDNSYEALHGLNVSVQETRGAANTSYNK